MIVRYWDWIGQGVGLELLRKGASWLFTRMSPVWKRLQLASLFGRLKRMLELGGHRTPGKSQEKEGVSMLRKAFGGVVGLAFSLCFSGVAFC